MTGVVRGLFGGSEERSQQQSGPVDVTPPEIRDLRGAFSTTLQRLLGQQGGDPLAGIPQFQGPLAAPMAGGENQLLQLLQQQAAGGQGQQLINQTLGGAFLPGQAGSNPFLQATIQAAQRPTLQGLEEVLSRTLPGRFTAAGQFVQPEGSSAFDRAAAIATRGAADALADIATNISFGAFESERGRQQEAIQLSQQEVATNIANLQAQALPRLIEQMGIEGGREEFARRLQTVLQALSVATGAPLQTVAQESSGSSEGRSSDGIFSKIPLFGGPIFG